MSINLYKDWDPSQGDYVDEHFQREIIKRRKDRIKSKIQFIFIIVISVALMGLAIYFVAKMKKQSLMDFYLI